MRPRILVEGASTAGPASSEVGTDMPSVEAASRRVRVEGAETALHTSGIGIAGYEQNFTPNITIEIAEVVESIPLASP